MCPCSRSYTTWWRADILPPPLAKDIFSIVFKEAFITRGSKNLWQGFLGLTLFRQFSVWHLNLVFYMYSLFTLRCRTLFYYGRYFKMNINRREWGFLQLCYNPMLTIPRKGSLIRIISQWPMMVIESSAFAQTKFIRTPLEIWTCDLTKRVPLCFTTSDLSRNGF